MSNPAENPKRNIRPENLNRLYRVPNAAYNDRTGWRQRHCFGVMWPKEGFESSLIALCIGWLTYADVHRTEYQSPIGDDGVLGPEWAAIGHGILGLLNGQLGRLDGGTLDGIVRETLQANAIPPEQ